MSHSHTNQWPDFGDAENFDQQSPNTEIQDFSFLSHHTLSDHSPISPLSAYESNDYMLPFTHPAFNPALYYPSYPSSPSEYNWKAWSSQNYHANMYLVVSTPDLFLQSMDSMTNLRAYLSVPNPRVRGPMEDPSLRRKNEKSADYAFIWWDIRNVRAWDTFNINTLTTTPEIQSLLDFPLQSFLLPEPSLNPENLDVTGKAAFTNFTKLYFCHKITTALSVALPEPVLSMVLGSEVGAQTQLVGLYSSMQHTIRQNRVPGLIKSAREWNSHMQAGADNRRREYLQVLSQLHRHMRDYDTRYGYILNEQELVCVRAVCDANGRPIFGCLDVSAPIFWNQHGTGRLTIGLALFYLHMLAKPNPVAGQYSWQLNVHSSNRQYLLPKDTWIPAPNQDDLQSARQHRGWGEADEPLMANEVLI